MKERLTYKDKKGIALVYVMVIILLLTLILVAILAAVANANRESAFVQGYEQMYYSAESASVVIAQTFMDEVATQLEEENKHSVQDAIDNGGLFYAISTSLDYDIVAHTTEKLREVLEDVINSSTITLLLQDELFEGQDFDWSVSIVGDPPPPPQFGTGFYVHYLNDLTAMVTVKIGLRESTVSIRFSGSMDTNLGANDANMLNATTDTEKDLAMRGILAGRQAFFDMGGALITGIDPTSNMDMFGSFGGSGGGNLNQEKAFFIVPPGNPNGTVPFGGTGGTNNTITKEIYVYPGQNIQMSGTYQLQMPVLNNIFTEKDSLGRGGNVILLSVSTPLTNNLTYVTGHGSFHFDGRHEGALNTLAGTPPTIPSAPWNILLGHKDTRLAQRNGLYDYFTFHDYDEFYQPVGTNFYVGGNLSLTFLNSGGSLVQFINNGRFAVGGNIIADFGPGTIIKGNSIFITEGTTTINTLGDFTIGEKDVRAPHFISRNNLTINYVQGSTIKLYGVFGTLGRYYGPNFVDDPNVDVAGVIYAAGGYYDSATGLPFTVPANFFDTRGMAPGTEYLDTSFFAEIFTLEDSAITSVTES
ncbi:MAG: hypothetical protein FWE41_05155 [Coriobacteriia bacterium]|nr:hypothetical protein [Coriobacteriia bacterium]MCL2749660.1 hypothetical protein [Coriobacteriia bacterium]